MGNYIDFPETKLLPAVAAARRKMAAGDGCRSASMRSQSSGVRLASLPAIVQRTHERATARRDAVPALPRAVGLGFERGA